MSIGTCTSTSFIKHLTNGCVGNKTRLLSKRTPGRSVTPLIESPAGSLNGLRSPSHNVRILGIHDICLWSLSSGFVFGYCTNILWRCAPSFCTQNTFCCLAFSSIPFCFWRVSLLDSFVIQRCLTQAQLDWPCFPVLITCYVLITLAYNSYTAVLTTFFPSRSRDLLAYTALIFRTAKRFGGKAWLEYDRAFRREAAANSLRDWSLMRLDLYNYHTALADRTVAISNEADQSSERSFREEPRGKPSAKQFCISWNKGLCRSTYQFCRFRHNCSSRVQWPAPSHRTRIQCYNSTLL